MGNSFNSPGDYRIEISGWGLDNRFFVERTELLWAANGDKQVQVHRALPEGEWFSFACWLRSLQRERCR
jgi:hypothetical protein